MSTSPSWLPEDWAVHRHLATAMDARLDWLTTIPQDIVLVGADFDASHALLHTRYPQARLCEYDADAERLAASARQRQSKRPWWRQWMARPTPQHQQSTDSPLGEGLADMLWSNLGLVAQGEPTEVFQHWSNALRPDGMVFFSHFGPDTLQEVLAWWRAHGLSVAPTRFWDMHDLGDMLFHHGFYDPVMDMDRLQLAYRTADKLMRDMTVLGLWDSLALPAADTAQAEQLLRQGFAEQQLSHITLEMVYGHAIKRPPAPDKSTQVIDFYPNKSRRQSQAD